MENNGQRTNKDQTKQESERSQRKQYFNMFSIIGSIGVKRCPKTSGNKFIPK